MSPHKLLTVGRTAAPFALPAALSAAAGLAIAQPGAPSAALPPAPRIHRHPLPHTHVTTAHFTFTDAGTGTRFLCSLDGRAYRGCDGSQIFRHLHGGAHRFQVVAEDSTGRRSRPAAYKWLIGAHRVMSISISTTPPTIVQTPPHSTGATTATFTFNDSAAGVSFLCAIDSHAPATCRSPITYARLSAGAHTFRVTAGYGVGQPSEPATYSWRVLSSIGGPVSVSGSAQGELYPGADPAPIPVTLRNPASTRVSVTGLTVSIDNTSLPAGCDLSSFQLNQSNVSSTQPVTVPGNGAVTLPAQGVTAPSIAMLDTNTDQDGCQGTTVTLDYGESTQP
jgi:hypothetical protein